MRKSRTSRRRKPLSLLLCASPAHATPLREQPSGRGKVIDNKQPERHRRDLEHPHQKKRHHHQRLENRHQGLEYYTTRSWGVLVMSYTCYSPWDVHSSTCGWGHTGCTASRDRQYKTQFKSRRYLRQHARDRSIGNKPPTTCVESTYTERGPFWISEDKNRVIKIPNDILRCILFMDQHRLESPEP